MLGIFSVDALSLVAITRTTEEKKTSMNPSGSWELGFTA
jgi:hypothetical protein